MTVGERGSNMDAQAGQLRYLLEQQQYRVTVAVDGAQALVSLKRGKPALVLSDIVMPGMDGYIGKPYSKDYLPSYEAAVWRSIELSRAQDELSSVNESLEELVEERTATLTAEIAERKKAEAAMAEAHAELREAIKKIKILSGLLQICAKCKKIRDDKGLWNQLETNISARINTEFTHGLCPLCTKELFGEFARGS